MKRNPTPSLAQPLLNWFDQHGRKNLPWQQQINPYRVWISEIMLQQTQVATVIPYFNRFMQSYATIDALAEANQDQVLHLWTGLGYYSRARNLHKTAQIIIEQHKGQLPNSLEALMELPGIGRSTAGAILAIAFQQPTSILDGNVKRVLARHYAVSGWPGNSATSKKLWQHADQQTPTQRVADYTQAIMDLGATLCTRTKPNCPNCPLNQTCVAEQQNTQPNYPGKKPKKILPVRNSIFAILMDDQGQILLQRRPPSGIWGGLWSFPEQPPSANLQQDIEAIANQYHCKIQSITTLAQQRHSFSHFHLDYTPIIAKVKQTNTIMEASGLVWYNTHQPIAIGTPAPIQKLLNQLKHPKEPHVTNSSM